MDRRSFLTGVSALVGGIALEQAIPFNRVWSFPKAINIAGRSLYGIPVFAPLSYTGTYMGITRSGYPGRLSTPNVDVGRGPYTRQMFADMCHRELERFERTYG